MSMEVLARASDRPHQNSSSMSDGILLEAAAAAREAEVSRAQSVPTKARLAVAACFFTNGVLVASWVSRIPAVQSRLGLNHAVLGLALLGLACGAVLAMPASGWFISRWGSRKLTWLTAAVYCSVLPFLAMAPNALALTAALFCFGAFHGAFDVAMNAQAVAVEARYRRPIMSSFHALWSLGCLIGAAIGGTVASHHVPASAHFLVATLIMGGLMLFVACPQLMEAGEAVAARAHAAVERRGWSRPPTSLLLLGAVAFCIMMGEGAAADWSAIYLRDVTGADEGLAAAGYAAFSLTMAFTRFLGDVLSARFGSAALVRVGSGTAALGLSLALLVTHPLVSIVGWAAVGAGFATIVPQVFTAAGNNKEVSSGAAISMVTTIGYMGFLIGPPVIGFVAEWVGLRLSLGIVVFMSVVAMFLAPSVRSPSRH